MSDTDPTHFDAKIAYERDRLVQQLAGLADALNGLPTERLAEVALQCSHRAGPCAKGWTWSRVASATA